MRASERYRVLQNIIAQAGGIENVNLHSELAKSEAVLNMHRAQGQFNDMNALQSNLPLGGQPTGGVSGGVPNMPVDQSNMTSEPLSPPDTGQSTQMPPIV